MTTNTTQPARFLSVDAVRVVALLLLIVYHCTAMFQPWANELGWIQNDRTLEILWLPMSMLNVWRIPILFMISGMGVLFAMRRRNNGELLKERSTRILLPFLFGSATLGPLCSALDQHAFGKPIIYEFSDYHLWFLFNIIVYVVVCIHPFRWLHNRPHGRPLNGARWLLRTGWFVPAFALPGMVCFGILQPKDFAAYFHTLHGWIYGAICFALGFVCACVMGEFQQATLKFRWHLSALGIGLWSIRVLELMHIPELHSMVNPVIAFESMVWMLAVLGHAFRHWSNGFTGLGYASLAVYPVYIVHQPIQNALALVIFPMPWDPWLKFALLNAGVLGGSVLLFEAIRRMHWLRPLFGMKRPAAAAR